MRIPGAKTAKTLSRWLQARIIGGGVILGYHRIADVARDDYMISVSPRHFDEQMEALNKYANPIQLSVMVKHLKAGSLPPRSVAVTFDDGYADVFYQAKPVLEKYNVPATVFVCTGYTGEEFWWDELDRLIISTEAELSTLRLQVGKNSFIWNQHQMMHRAKNLDVRRKFCHMLYHFLLPLDVGEQQHAMNIIRSWSGVSSDNRSSSRTMKQAELLQLTESGLIDLGSHTQHHPLLPLLSLERQREEIVLSKQDLEELLGRQVDGFTYPNGRATKAAKQIVYEAGFAFACTSQNNVVRGQSDLHELPRFWPKNVDGNQFMRYMKSWM